MKFRMHSKVTDHYSFLIMNARPHKHTCSIFIQPKTKMNSQKKNFAFTVVNFP